MFWGLSAGVVDTGELRVRARPRGHPDPERVGARGPPRGDGDLAARVPVRAGPATCILPHGASMGSGYGPIVVSTRAADAGATSRRSRSPCPGRMTTAFLVLRLYLGGDFRFREVPFDQIIDEVEVGPRRGRPAHPRGPAHVRAHGLAQRRRPRRVVAARDRACRCRSGSTSRGATSASDMLHELSEVLRDSIAAGLANREEALEYALQYGRGLDRRARRPLRRHVRERADRGLRRRGPRGRRRAPPPRRGDRRLRAAGPRRVRELGRR